MVNVKPLILLDLMLASDMPVESQTPEEMGLEIATAARAYDHGFKEFTGDMVMILKKTIIFC